MSRWPGTTNATSRMSRKIGLEKSGGKSELGWTSCVQQLASSIEVHSTTTAPPHTPATATARRRGAERACGTNSCAQSTAGSIDVAMNNERPAP